MPSRCHGPGLALSAVVFVGILMLMVSLARAASYYVDNTGGSDSNAGTSAAPWKSLAKVNSTTFRAGDTINFKRGGVWTGTLQVRHSGTSTAPITYQAYGTGAAPQIKNPGVQWGHAIDVTGDYNTVRDFLVTNAHEAGVWIGPGADRNTIRNNEVSASGTGVMVNGQYNLITSNYVHDLLMIVNTQGGNEDYGAVCFWFYAGNNELSYNRGERCRAPSYDFGYDGGFMEFSSNGDNTYIHHNWIENTVGLIEFGSGSAVNVRVAHNVIVMTLGATGAGLCFGNMTVTNFRFEHNTVYQQSADGSQAYRMLACRNNFSFVSMRNNIFYSNMQIANTPPGTHTHNLYHMVNMVSGAGVGYGLDPSERSGVPLFVNAGAENFRLQSGSPAINTGTNLGYTKDYDGKTIPIDGAYDMGAFEFGSSGGSGGSGTVTSVNDTEFRYTGNWLLATGTGKYLNDDHYTNSTNAFYTYTFTGTQTRVYIATAPWHGRAAVSVDGGPETIVDLYSPTKANQVLIYTSPTLVNGTHTVKVRCTGTRNPSSTGNYITADRIDIIH